MEGGGGGVGEGGGAGCAREGGGHGWFGECWLGEAVSGGENKGAGF